MTQSCRADISVVSRKSNHRPLSGSHFARSIVVLLAMLLITAKADADVIDFSGSGGNLGTSSVNIGGIVIDGFYFNGSWLPANLTQRDEDPSDHGLGVCNPSETCTFPGGGDINELDNNGNPELIRLTLPAGFFWTEVGISSMDDNGGSPLERGEAFATNDGDPSNLLPNPFIPVLGAFWQFDGNDDPLFELTHPVTGGDQLLQYIFFRPFDWSGGNGYYNTDNDFLVWQATIEPIPEPGTLALLAAGLLGLVLAARRKKS